MRALTVLVVDDDELTRKLAGDRLERRGMHVMRAADGATALRLARERAPDLVLLDIQMPGMSGVDVLQALRADPKLAATKLVAMTASVSRAQGLLQGVGFDAVLTKPFERQQPMRVIAALLGVDPAEPT